LIGGFIDRSRHSPHKREMTDFRASPGAMRVALPASNSSTAPDPEYGPVDRRVSARPQILLIVDDQDDLRRMWRFWLGLWNFRVVEARDGLEALVSTQTQHPIAIVMDLWMPRLDGLETSRRLRRQGDRTPVLMLTARDAVGDRVEGLDAGADDYLVKPFALEELLARIRALLRRSLPNAEEEPLVFEDLRLDPVAHEVHRGERRIELTRTEYLLLELFLHHPRQVLTRSQIFERVWGYDFGPSSNSLEVYIGYLRRKTEAGGESRLLHTVRGVGYVLRQGVT